MLISHRHQFIIFPDPLDSCQWVRRALAPWVDQPLAGPGRSTPQNPYFKGMTPAEVQAAFTREGRVFDAYTRIAIVQNPYLRLAQLYDRITDQDPVWRLKARLGLPPPRFSDWLSGTRPDGHGAGHALSPRWRRHAAWSAQAWCDGRITHVIRAERAKADLARVFRLLGLTPSFTCRKDDQHKLHQRALDRYQEPSKAMMRERYRSDLDLLSRGA